MRFDLRTQLDDWMDLWSALCRVRDCIQRARDQLEDRETFSVSVEYVNKQVEGAYTALQTTFERLKTIPMPAEVRFMADHWTA